jgi:hypothetical protein
MDMRRSYFLIALLLSAFLSACAGSPTPADVGNVTAVAVAEGGTAVPATTGGGTAVPAITGEPTAVPQPQSGKATVVGHVFSQKTGAPITQTFVMLAEVTRQDNGEGIYVLDTAHSPTDETDQQGTFVMPDIVAKEYVVIVGDPYQKYVVVPDQENKARIWNVPADQILNIGDLRVDLDQ